jgi:protein-tyrosine kinase
MESFINALARSQEASWAQVKALASADIPGLKVSEGALTLSPKALMANRVVSFDGAHSVTRSYDVLRNTCIKDLAARIADRPIIGVTSPGKGCGASTTSINLAFSLARLQKAAVLLADFTPAGEGWWRQLGLDQASPSGGAMQGSVIAMDVAGCTIHAANLRHLVSGKSGDESKRALRDWTTAVRRDLGPVTIVLDLPPLLTDDRGSSFISELDLVVLVLSAGQSTMADLETSKTYLHDAASVQLVLNKARDYDL